MENSGKKTISALIRWLAVSTVLFIPTALADAPQYTLHENDSSLSFIATQNNAPVKGAFKRFTADIRFDPEKLEESSIRVEIDIASLAMADTEILATLKTPEWFSTDLYPKAVYESVSIKHGDTANDYIAEGTLTLKSKTVPLTLYFTMERLEEGNATASGNALLKRNDFAVGEGQWAEDGLVKNEVRIEFYISAHTAQ